MTNDTIAIVIISLLTLNLLVVGFYIILVLKEIRSTMKKANSLLETVDSVAENFTRPLVQSSEFIVGLTQGLKVLSSVREHFAGVEEDVEEA